MSLSPEGWCEPRCTGLKPGGGSRVARESDSCLFRERIRSQDNFVNTLTNRFQVTIVTSANSRGNNDEAAYELRNPEPALFRRARFHTGWRCGQRPLAASGPMM